MEGVGHPCPRARPRPPCTPTCAEAEPSCSLVSLGNRAEAKIILGGAGGGSETWPEELCTQGPLPSHPVLRGQRMVMTAWWHTSSWGCERGCAGGSLAVVGGFGEGILVMEHRRWVLPCCSQMTKMGR